MLLGAIQESTRVNPRAGREGEAVAKGFHCGFQRKEWTRRGTKAQDRPV